MLAVFYSFIKKNKIVLLFFCISIIVRVLYLILVKPPLQTADSGIYDGIAWNFIQGNGYSLSGQPFAGREPGYSLFFLAPLYLLFGHNFLPVQIFQIILSSVFVFAIYFLIRKELSPTVATLVAFCVALHPLLICYSSEILTEIPFTILLFFGLWIAYISIKRESAKLCIVAGILLGMAILTRFVAIFLPFALILFAHYYFREWKKTFRYGAIFISTMFLLVAPWIMRNYIVFDTFIFGRAGSSEIYWSGSYIPWDGEWLGYGTSPLKELSPPSNTATLAVDKVLMPLVFQNIKNNPIGVLKIWLKKPIKIFTKADFKTVLERENNIKGYSSKINFSFIRYFLTAINLIILLLWTIGLWSLRKSNPALAVFLLLIIIYFLIFYLPVNPDSRYKIPLFPYLFIGAAVGFQHTTKFFLEKLRRAYI